MLPEALLFAARAWSYLRDRIEPDEVELIRRHLAGAVHGGQWDAGQLMAVLFGHEGKDYPGWGALAERPVRGPATLAPPPLAAAAATLRLRVEEDELATALTELVESPDPDAVERAAEERLWIVPMLELPAPDTGRSLVVLTRGMRSFAPVFQFARGAGVVAPGVEDVNRILGASEDPWGAASWWLTPHAALDAIPADALRVGEREAVTAAARAACELD